MPSSRESMRRRVRCRTVTAQKRELWCGLIRSFDGVLFRRVAHCKRSLNCLWKCLTRHSHRLSCTDKIAWGTIPDEGTASKWARLMTAKRILVAKTDKPVFSSPQTPDEHSRWLELADTALHNPKPQRPTLAPGSSARERYRQLKYKVRDLLKQAA